ncbi:head GIN domain-containing protein [Pareuzebyella sediminis]|uniref:head GIN domain-containing protein n=1 Tax=Pareuzebyella sediminis TaxID=2607998 RepID=UPI0011ED7318|nr:head GIN domain-containing protein [Pareuzebyella sediminis]
MKKLSILTIICLFVSLGAWAQKTTIDLEPFNELKVFDRINVTLVKSSENTAIVTGDDQDGVKISNDNGLLKIRMDVTDFLDGDETFVELRYTENLELLDVNEGAKITSSETLHNNFLNLRSQEGGQLNIAVDSRNLNAKAISGGKIMVTGKAPNQEASIRSGGEYDAKNLSAKQTEVTVFAGGKAYVNSDEYVAANVTAGGRIEIFGNPEKVDEDKTLGGTIIMKK